jgi:hypothetical protein
MIKGAEEPENTKEFLEEEGEDLSGPEVNA